MIGKSVDILIVESDETEAERMQQVLKSRMLNVTMARNSADALAAASAKRPTLILSAVHLPGSDGYALCKKIKANPDLATVPVVLLTPLSEPGDVMRGLESGASGLIVKPYDDRHLLDRVEATLANAEMHQDPIDGGVEI